MLQLFFSSSWRRNKLKFLSHEKKYMDLETIMSHWFFLLWRNVLSLFARLYDAFSPSKMIHYWVYFWLIYGTLWNYLMCTFTRGNPAISDHWADMQPHPIEMCLFCSGSHRCFIGLAPNKSSRSSSPCPIQICCIYICQYFCFKGKGK